MRRVRRYSNQRRTYSGRKYAKSWRRYSRRKVGYRRRRRTPNQMKATRPLHLLKTTKTTYTLNAAQSSVLFQSYTASALGCVKWDIIPDYTSLTAVFKRYRINKIYMQINLPYNTNNPAVNPSSADPVQFGRCYIVPDPTHRIDPSTVTENDLLEMGADVKRFDMNGLKTPCIKYKTNVFTLLPGPATDGASTGQNYTTATKRWYNTSCNNIVHTWGFIKWFTDNQLISVPLVATCIIKYYFSVVGNR